MLNVKETCAAVSLFIQMSFTEFSRGAENDSYLKCWNAKKDGGHMGHFWISIICITVKGRFLSVLLVHTNRI